MQAKYLKIGSLYVSLGKWKFSFFPVGDWYQIRFGFLRISYMPGYTDKAMTK